MLDAFKTDSDNEIIDWEGFSQFLYMDMIEYINYTCLLEDTKVDHILIKLKEKDAAEFLEHIYEILRAIDTKLMTDQFLSMLMPRGSGQGGDCKVIVLNRLAVNEESKHTISSSRTPLDYDPVPFQIIAKRFFIEEIRPNKAYFQLMAGLKKGISDLDSDVLAAYEISELFKLQKKDKIISKNTDIKQIISFSSSFDRFTHLIENSDFLPVR
jgi:hypothetical protein